MTRAAEPAYKRNLPECHPPCSSPIPVARRLHPSHKTIRVLLFSTPLLAYQTARKLTIKKNRSIDSQPHVLCQAEAAAKKIGGTAQWTRQSALAQAPTWSGLLEGEGSGLWEWDMNERSKFCNVVAKIEKAGKKYFFFRQ